MRLKFMGVLLLLLCGGTSVSRGQTAIAEARATVEKWVETRQLISRTASDWQADKETIQQTIALFSRELASLNEQLALVSTNSTQADKERAIAAAEHKELNAAQEWLKTSATALERTVAGLAAFFPQPLVERLEPLLKRIPAEPSTTRMSAVERMQNVVGILSEIDKFNSSVTVVSEIQKTPAGVEVQVETLYLGLAQAYFVDKAGAYTGIGVPSEKGWVWSERKDLAPAVRKAIAMYQNSQPAAFVRLPIQIK